MFGRFLSKLNLCSFSGSETKLNDLIQHPLQPNETLMQDSQGCYHRIKAPTKHSNFLEKCFFWFQIHLNRKGHLVAIDNMIDSFQQEILNTPIKTSEDMQKIKVETDHLRALKNDYRFNTSSKDPVEIEKRLKLIEKEAYKLFSSHTKEMAQELEDRKVKFFEEFKTAAQTSFKYLKNENHQSMLKMQFLMTYSSAQLNTLFDERVTSIRFRIHLIQGLNYRIVLIRKDHLGQFTIPSLSDCLNALSETLKKELELILFECNVLTENLMINYCINPAKEEIEQLFSLIKINPFLIKCTDEMRPVSSALHGEIDAAMKEI